MALNDQPNYLIPYNCRKMHWLQKIIQLSFRRFFFSLFSVTNFTAVVSHEYFLTSRVGLSNNYTLLQAGLFSNYVLPYLPNKMSRALMLTELLCSNWGRNDDTICYIPWARWTWPGHHLDTRGRGASWLGPPTQFCNQSHVQYLDVDLVFHSD